MTAAPQVATHLSGAAGPRDSLRLDLRALDRVPPRLRRHLPLPITVIAAVLVLHGVDLGHAAHALAAAQWGWLAVGLTLTGLSTLGSAIAWGLLARGAGAEMSWVQIVIWSARALFAGQLLPGGAGGDAVRSVAVGRVCGAGVGVAANCGARLAGALGMALWGLAGAVLLRGAIGNTALGGAAALALVMILATALALNAERVVAPLRRRRALRLRRLGDWLHTMAHVLAGYRRRPALAARCGLLGCAAWGLELAALVTMGHAVGVDVSWQVFAVSIPVTLMATLMPLSANGVGVREGILVGLLVRGGAGTGQAAALSLLVDIQYLPLALVGGLLWLRRVGGDHCQPALRVAQPAAVLAPVAIPVVSG